MAEKADVGCVCRENQAVLARDIGGRGVICGEGDVGEARDEPDPSIFMWLRKREEVSKQVSSWNMV